MGLLALGVGSHHQGSFLVCPDVPKVLVFLLLPQAHLQAFTIRNVTFLPVEGYSCHNLHKLIKKINIIGKNNVLSCSHKALCFVY